MKVAIFTTLTTHHNFFLEQISKFHNPKLIIYDTRKVLYKFKTNHPFEKKRQAYEKKFIKKYKFTNTFKVNNINSKKVEKLLNFFKIDYIFVFGANKIKKNIISKFKDKIFNFHGGNPEEYRGLDSHLWSIYHNDSKGICTCIHKVEKYYDTGNIIFKKKIKLNKINNLYKLRLENTINCIKLYKKLINNIKKNKKIVSKKQIKIGRYYSAMPKSLKDICNDKFVNLIND
jgi:methionyl-tRNA formyltransferase